MWRVSSQREGERRMAGTDNTGTNSGHDSGHGYGQDGWDREWDALFPPIDYRALDQHARHAASLAVTRCWIVDDRGGDTSLRGPSGHWSDEMRSDFGVWAEELTAAYMAESHALFRPGRIFALMRSSAEMTRAVQVAMRGRQNAIQSRYWLTCYEALWAEFSAFARAVGCIPRQTLPPAPQQPQPRRKEVI